MSTLPLNGAKLIVVEDDPEIRTLLADLLTGEGGTVNTAKDAAGLDLLLRKFEPELIILDLMLPGEDGLSICRRIRATSPVPILMLTARGEDIDKIIGLEMGADDYLAKPFNPRELIARIKAILRRASGEIANAREIILKTHGFLINTGARTVKTEEGDTVPLTGLEFDLFTCFLKNPMLVLSRDQLLDWTRGRTYDATDRTIDVQVSRLRKKLEAAGAPGDMIRTIRNSGYILAAKIERA
ncbi:MAG: response regulator [Methyloligellaceae bacterium]